MTNEIPFLFSCQEKQLLGIAHVPEQYKKTGVLIVVGGPQYRVGSHRQFLLLARFLADNGIPVLRFDYRGMGDSDGELRHFDRVNDDIETAIDSFFKHCPELKNVCIWGLCDAASAALFYAHKDERVVKLLLLNPWVRTEAGEAKAYLKHYYLTRIISKEFWYKIFSGKFRIIASLKSVLGISKTVFSNASKSNSSLSLPEQMLSSMQKFKGEVLIILSGKDLTAAEFRDLIDGDNTWQSELEEKAVEIKILPEANHTFSTREWRSEVEALTLEWVNNSGKSG